MTLGSASAMIRDTITFIRFGTGSLHPKRYSPFRYADGAHSFCHGFVIFYAGKRNLLTHDMSWGDAATLVGARRVCGTVSFFASRKENPGKSSHSNFSCDDLIDPDELETRDPGLC
jgi:hypothetical protein